VKWPEHSFVFPTELGGRLRDLRKRAGFSQDELARKMGRPGRHAGSLVSRLERGGVKYPSFALVADFLRACGAGFGDVLDILDRYTRQPRVDEQIVSGALARIETQLPEPAAKQVRRYNAQVEAPKEPAARPGRTPDPLKRLERARRNAAAVRVRQAVNRALREQACNNMPVKPTMLMVETLVAHGQKVFTILRAGLKDGPDAVEQRVAEAEAWLVRQEVPQAAVRWMTDVTRQVFEQMKRSGELDWLPNLSLSELDKKLLARPKPRRVARPPQAPQVDPWDEWKKARGELVKRIWQEAQELLRREAGPDAPTRLYNRIMDELCVIVDMADPAGTKCRDQIAACIAQPGYTRYGVAPEPAQRFADFVVLRYEELRRSLPKPPYHLIRPTSVPPD